MPPAVPRRTALAAGAAALTAPLLPTATGNPVSDAPPTYPFAVPPLAFSPDALEPHIDGETMRIHHDKHHAGYVSKLNAAIENVPALHGKSIEDILRNFGDVPDDIKTAVRNNGGGHANHQFFWKILRPSGTAGAGGEPAGDLKAAIEADFRSVDAMKEEFTKAALGVFGSGWAFLVADPQTYKLSVVTTANQDSVLLPREDGTGLGAGLFCCDVWEHAYYLKHRNRRADYLAAFFEVLAWDIVADRLANLKAGKDHL